MKRSEIVTKIAEYLNSIQNADTHIADSIRDAAELMKLLEEAGMAPPEVKEPVETLYQDASGKVVRGEDSTLFVRKWEDEA